MSRIPTFLAAAIVSVPAICADTASSPARFIPSLFKIDRDSQADSLVSEGVEVLRRRGDILLCLFPDRERTAPQPARARRIAPALDVARRYYQADGIQSAAAAGVPYTGKGIVTGICDIGFDPLHPTFLDADGNSRVRRMTHYVEEQGIRRVLEGTDDYSEWVTDNPDEYHATHVCGILAGGGAGTPYSGIATDADIVVSVSTLTDVGLLAGVEDIIDYAKEAGKPAVINMSVGSYTGPHDGSSLFSQYLDMCADDAVIVLSSGNEGDNRNTLLADFTDDCPSVSFRVGNTAWDEFEMTGITDIWSGGPEPLSVTLKAYDSDARQVAIDLGTVSLARQDSFTFSWDGSCPEAYPFQGKVMVEGGIDPENGRFRAVLAYDFRSPEPASAGPWARYELAVEVAGRQGCDVEIYADGIHTRLMGMSGSTAPSTLRTVSDLACGHRVISAGMYGNRATAPVTAFPDGDTREEPTGFGPAGTVVYSSYGTLRDGRVLPLTVAPGAPLVSACSSPYLALHPEEPHLDLGSQWAPKSGTSMASPYVAGYIATWLEAVPGLTAEDVMELIRRSNRTDIPDPDDPHNACGWFDPVAGLREALSLGGVESVPDPLPLLRADDTVTVFSLTGARVYEGKARGLSAVGKGLYVVRTPYGVMKSALPVRIP